MCEFDSTDAVLHVSDVEKLTSSKEDEVWADPVEATDSVIAHKTRLICPPDVQGVCIQFCTRYGRDFQ